MKKAVILIAMLALSTRLAAADLAKPFATESSVKRADVVGWPDGKTPMAPEGFRVTKFAGDLDNPRNMFVMPNGDVLVAESKTGKVMTGANRVTLLRDGDKDGIAETRHAILKDLNQPFGISFVKGHLYIANTDGVMRFPYQTGDTQEIKTDGIKIVALPAKGYNNHWTRNIIANKDETKFYISVGSGSNIAEHGMEHEVRRANILEVNIDGTGEKVFASGLRNPVGMDFELVTGKLWTAVNERDGLGDELVPDYLTSVQEGGFYGWPYSYFGQHVDPRIEEQRPDLVKKAIVPDVDLGSHTASLGLAFYDADAFPAQYRGGAFIGQHGSWNHSRFVGYKVSYVPFKNGKPAGAQQDFLTGFIKDEEKSEVYGRPVGVAVTKEGGLLVADDAGNSIWHVMAEK